METIMNLIIKLFRGQQALALQIERSKITSEQLDVMGV